MLLENYEEHDEEFIRRNVKGDETWVLHYTSVSKAELMTSPLQKTVLSPGKGTATIFCDVCVVLLVDSTPHGSTINATPYQETLKETQGGPLSKETRMLIEGILLNNNAGPHCTAAVVDLLTS